MSDFQMRGAAQLGVDMMPADAALPQELGGTRRRKELQVVWKSAVAHLRRALIWCRLRRHASRKGFRPADLGRFYQYLSTSLGLENPQHTDPLQLPRNHFPGLRSQAVYDPSEFPAAAALADDFRAIRDELSQYSIGLSLDPHPQDLTDRGLWRVFYFYAGGRPTGAAKEAYPQTAQAIAAFPGSGEAGQAYLSVLDPGTHIEPHCGPTNTRLRAHFGLAVPDGARIRLGSEICRWEEGHCLIFDDSFEHEVWNEGGSERAVLIIDFWHPDLTPAERWAIAAARKLRWGLRDILHA